MRSCIIIIIFLVLSTPNLQAQRNNNPPKPGTKLYQVSGIILDSAGMPLTMANIKLISAKDSLLTSSDNDGVFLFENIKMATFVLSVSEVGYKQSVRRYLNNEKASKIVLEPIVLHDQSYQLKQVNINGTPSIVYKTDTVEFRAGDYKVSPYATIDELLKRMEGMEIGPNGSLIYNGQQITKAKLNGKVFSGGSVAQAIQNLPANIADKIQIVDDYGDQAARTGIRSGDPAKTLNITTRADKSIGNLATISSQEGNNRRFNQQLSLQNIYANRVINLIGDIGRTVNGIASSGAVSTPAPINGGAGGVTSGVSRSSLPGTTLASSPTFSYTNSWNNKIIITGSYSYSFNNTNSVSDNYGQINSSIGRIDFKNNSTAVNNMRGHNLKLELDYNIGKFDYLQVNPIFNYSNSSFKSIWLTDNLNYFTTGFEHPIVKLDMLNPTSGYNYGLTGLYVHSFTNVRRNFSIQIGLTESRNEINGDKNAAYKYYADTTENVLIKDSLSHILIFKNSNSKVFRSVITYAEPLNAKSQFEFTAQIRNSIYDNKALSDTVLANGELQEIKRLANIYNFSFTESRLTANFRYTGEKCNFSIGAAVVPTTLSGSQIDNNTYNYIATSRSDFRTIPIFRFSYAWSIVEKLQVMYTGTNNEPDFQQIQPFTDKSDPNNIITGNPNLKPTFSHNITAIYSRYFPNDKFNVSFNVRGIFYENQITTNVLQVTIPISSSLNRTINEISFVNVNGDKSFNGNYSVSKQLNNRNYNLALNGYITYEYTNAVSNNMNYQSTRWDFNERFGPRITLNDDKFQINPFIGYEVSKSSANTLNALSSVIKTLKFAVDGNIYFPRNFQVHYSGSKNFISGFPNYNLNPLVINAGLEKRLLRKHNLALTFDVFDLFHQNNFIQQFVTPQSTIYTLSNTNSRYFLIGFKLNLQKWGGTPMQNGQPMKRRGDGSFIN